MGLNYKIIEIKEMGRVVEIKKEVPKAVMKKGAQAYLRAHH